MDKKTLSIIGGIAILFLVLGLAVNFFRSTDNTTRVPTVENPGSFANNNQETGDSVLSTPTPRENPNPQPVAPAPGTQPGTQISDNYYNYSPDAVQLALEEGNTAVLFYHASWCPTCRSADKDIQNNADQLPDNVVIFKTDYDNEVASKDQYNVTYQHTFVALTPTGEELTQWRGGSVSTIVQNLENPL